MLGQLQAMDRRYLMTEAQVIIAILMVPLSTQAYVLYKDSCCLEAMGKELHVGKCAPS